jgi:hypothetical protein
MQNKKKYSLIVVISALIIGLPTFFLSQAEESLPLSVQADEILLNLEKNYPNAAFQAVNKAPAPAAGIDTSLAISTDQEVELETEHQNPIDRIKAIHNKNELHQSLIDDNENFIRYPEYNTLISEVTKDPTTQRYEIDERTTQNKDDKTSLTIWTNKKYYLQGDQATIFASLRDAKGNPIPTQFIGQLIYNEKSNLQTLNFSDNNQDGIYEYSLPLMTSSEQKFDAGLYKVLIINKTNKVTDAVTFILSKPEIELTGNFKDQVSKKGELLIEAEVTVSEQNRFYFQASLYSANKIPIGSTQQAVELSPGKHWIRLPFDGALIRDVGESGPFLLKNLSLAKVTFPMQRAPLIHPDFFTNDYNLDQFRSTQESQNDSLQAAK